VDRKEWLLRTTGVLSNGEPLHCKTIRSSMPLLIVATVH
jgi:hypothetical protein